MEVDMTLCRNHKCDRRKECFRYMAVPYTKWQSYAVFDGDNCFEEILPYDVLREDVDKEE